MNLSRYVKKGNLSQINSTYTSCFLRFLLLLVISSNVQTSFSDCLTDCVKDLGDSELDHTKLFKCSTSCNEQSKDRKTQAETFSFSRQSSKNARKSSASGSSESPCPTGGCRKPKGGGNAASSGQSSSSSSAAPTAPNVAAQSIPESPPRKANSQGKRKASNKSRPSGDDPPPKPSLSPPPPPPPQSPDPLAMAAAAETGGGSNSEGSQQMKDVVRLLLLGAGERQARATGKEAGSWREMGPEEWRGWSSGANASLAPPHGSVREIYASYVLQTFHFGLGDEVRTALRRWYEALAPGGRLLVSVPDLATLCWLYLGPSGLQHRRFSILQMMMGRQEDLHQVFRSGFDLALLSYYLADAGFTEYERVAELGVFDDDSSAKVNGVLVSLNVIAYKSGGGEEADSDWRR